MSGLRLTGLCKTFRPKGKPTVSAVDGVDLVVAPGELVGLLGPSGCGKSTTLRMIAGLEDPTSGDIRIGDRSMLGLRPQDRNVGVAFENYALYPPLTVRQNIGFGLDARRVTGVDGRVRDVAERIGLTDILDIRPAALSSGQKQRVALARAIAREPDVLLLDEPLSHLDAGQRDRTRRELRRLQRELGYTTILVTHDQDEALGLADRVAVMHDGRVRQVGSPDQIYDDPADLFVAEFVGEPAMNLLAGRLLPDRTVELEPGVRVPVPIREPWPADGSESGSAERAVLLGVRPEDVSLDGELPGRTVVVEDLQEYGLVTLQLDGGGRVVAQTPAGLPVGERARIGFHSDRTFVFDHATGERIR